MIYLSLRQFLEAVVLQMFFQKVVLKNFTNFKPATLLKGDSNTAKFSCEIYEIFEYTFFYRTPLMIASKFLC